MALEMGYERFDSGVLHLAVRTDMRGCSGAMFDWWFGSRPSTREYVWWHPIDHIYSDWMEGSPGRAVGSIHTVEERFADQPAQKLSIQFRDPSEFFDNEALARARRSAAISCAVCAHGGAGHQPNRKPSGEVIGSRLFHIGRDTEWGLALRTHFVLGHDLVALGMPAAELRHIFPDELGPALLQHCYEEFTYLSRFLPSLYLAENRQTLKPKRPW
jgi:DAPG hydrolase PhiG domain